MKSFKNNKNGKILNLLLSIIALFVIIFVIVWIVNKNNNTQNIDTIFNQNLTSMQTTAKKFFASDLPKEINDKKTLTLNELINLKLSGELSYGKTACDNNASYVEIKKINVNEFQVTSYLICGEKSDNIIEKIKLTTSENDVIDNNNNNNNSNDKTNNDKIDSPSENSSNKDSACVNCNDRSCQITEIPTVCETTYAYEYVKRSASCENGYNYNGNECIKTLDLTTNTATQTVIKSAKKTSGNTNTIYDKTYYTTEEDKYYCTTGILSGKYCYQYADYTTNSSSSYYCDDANATLKNNKCYVNASTKLGSEYCANGSTPQNGKCYANPTTTPGSEYCANGSTPQNGKCYANPTTTPGSEYCANGSTPQNGKCYTDIKESTSTTYSCKDGSTPVNGKCESRAIKSYTAWGNPSKSYSTTTNESTYESELEKKILVGSKSYGTYTLYNYQVYNRTSYYTCSYGTLSGTKCLTDAIKNTTSSATCPSGYTKSGNTCYTSSLTSSSTTTCPSGYTKSGNTCYTSSLTSSSTTTCPSGYTKSGNTCYTSSLTSSSTTTCPSGYTKDGNSCSKAAKTSTSSSRSCPSGYTDNGSSCYIKSNAKVVYGESHPYCANGYTLDKNNKCYKNVHIDGELYCEDASATLKDDKCYLEGPSNECAKGYIYSSNDNLCHKTTYEKKAPVYGTIERKYSSESYLPGYTRTGNYSYVMTCKPAITK